MTPIFNVTIVLFIVLFVYLSEKIYREYDCFAQCIRDVYAVQDIFGISWCWLGDKDYEFRFVQTVPEKRQDAVYILFDEWYKNGAIFSLEKEGKRFVPQIRRDKLLIEMGIILSGVEGQIKDYEATDALWQALFRKQYKKLKELAPKLRKLYDTICSMETNSVFCTPIEL